MANKWFFECLKHLPRMEQIIWLERYKKQMAITETERNSNLKKKDKEMTI